MIKPEFTVITRTRVRDVQIIYSLEQFDTNWKKQSRALVSRAPARLNRGRGSAGDFAKTLLNIYLAGMAVLDQRPGVLTLALNISSYGVCKPTHRERRAPQKARLPQNQSLRRPEVRLPRPILVREQFRRRLRALHRQSHIVVRHAVRAHQLLNLRVGHGLAASTGLHRF